MYAKLPSDLSALPRADPADAPGGLCPSCVLLAAAQLARRARSAARRLSRKAPRLFPNSKSVSCWDLAAWALFFKRVSHGSGGSSR